MDCLRYIFLRNREGKGEVTCRLVENIGFLLWSKVFLNRTTSFCLSSNSYELVSTCGTLGNLYTSEVIHEFGINSPGRGIHLKLLGKREEKTEENLKVFSSQKEFGDGGDQEESVGRLKTPSSLFVFYT